MEAKPPKLSEAPEAMKLEWGQLGLKPISMAAGVPREGMKS
jgi:hypothetical protein